MAGSYLASSHMILIIKFSLILLKVSSYNIFYFTSSFSAVSIDTLRTSIRNCVII